jgi:hypothetical protein
MAAAKRASLKSIWGRASVKAAHKTSWTSVENMPAAMPAQRAARQFTRFE